ncbi:ferredoxin [Mycobacterium paraffinicum]|uniref:Ferredoxin n=1 Tax=Mycobacterium paraffinicum TaxID=53378 RepID=A0A1Q4I2D6_9MYCO|nr:ferredoxin [Mycobacterium paraffinicum]OJZ76103.1 ferredoxin [Mycobacterium paraffinicum]
MKVVVDWEICESNALCMAEAPEVFEMQPDDTMKVLQEEPDESLRAKVVAAAHACPKQAIRIRD